jgi:hypothetical protein
MFDDSNEADPEKARTEVLAQAFDDAAGEYFSRIENYEDNISEARAERTSAKQIGAVAAIAGLVVLAVGFVLDTPVIGGAGALIGVVGVGYAYTKYAGASERIRENEQNIEQNEPDGEVTFVSQVGVPLYLAPYRDEHMIFDGLDNAPQTSLELANIDGDTLVSEGERLDRRQQDFEKQMSGAGSVSPEFVEEFSPDVTEHRGIEQPLVDQIDRMSEVMESTSRETVDINVHANNQKTKSVRVLAREGHLRSHGDLRLVETRRSADETEALVNDIRGVEAEAISGDTLDQAEKQHERVDEIATGHVRRLRTNSERIQEHFESYSDSVARSMHKYVCEECLKDEIESITDEFGLVDEILETGSLGNALSDEDLDDENENFTQQIREDIGERIPELDDRLKKAYNTLDDLGADGGHCETHERVDTTEVADSGAVFAEVWDSLYDALREPMLNRADELESSAEDIRQQKEQEMVDLTQYEQIKNDAMHEYESAKSDYDAARTLERELE